MISVVVCFCPNADIRAYHFLQRQVENWMDVPLYRGKENTLKFLNSLGKNDDLRMHTLLSLLEKTGKYIVVVGWDEDRVEWSNISHNDMKSLADAELIVEEFA